MTGEEAMTFGYIGDVRATAGCRFRGDKVF